MGKRKRGKSPLEAIRQHPELVVHHDASGYLTFPLASMGDTSDPKFFEIRGPGGQLATRSDGQNLYFCCPACNHVFPFSHQDFFDMADVVWLTGKSYGWRCSRCKQPPIIFKIIATDGQPRVEVRVK